MDRTPEELGRIIADEPENEMAMSVYEDEQRDMTEEMDNAMTPFRENMRLVFTREEWSPAMALNYINVHGYLVGEVEGELVIHTGLMVAPDGSIWEGMEE